MSIHVARSGARVANISQAELPQETAPDARAALSTHDETPHVSFQQHTFTETYTLEHRSHDDIALLRRFELYLYLYIHHGIVLCHNSRSFRRISSRSPQSPRRPWSRLDPALLFPFLSFPSFHIM